MSWDRALPGSRAPRRYNCPGSHYLESLYPQERSNSAEEGILAHTIAANRIRFLLNAKFEDTSYFSESDEMHSSVEMYVNDFFKEHKIGNTTYLGVEEEIKTYGGVTDISTSVIDSFMIKDYPNKIQVIIWDFKYGHKNVEAFHNWQLLNYAAAINNNILCNTPKYKETEFILKIIQPRVFNGDKIKIWEVDKNTYNQLCEKLFEKEKLSLAKNAPRFVSEECFTCRARHACPTLREASLNSITIASNHSPYSLPAEEIGEELRVLEQAKQVLDARINGLKQQALQYLRKGERVNFYELQQAMSRLSWDASPQRLKGLEQLTGVSLMKQDFITPKQAIDNGLPVDIVLKYASRKSGEIKLVPQSELQLTKIFQENQYGQSKSSI